MHIHTHTHSNVNDGIAFAEQEMVQELRIR